MTEPENAPTRENKTNGLSFFAELRQRRVYQSAVAYAIVAWGITEILDGVIEGMGWPDWLATLAVIVFVTGFPVAMFLAWIYDWTPEGIRRSSSSGPLGWLPGALAGLFLIAGSAGLFWLINPSGIVRTERIGVAVLPCRYRGDPEYAFRGEGVADVLNTRLAYYRELFVPSFVATLSIAAAHPETRSLAGQLGVDYLVDCRVAEERDGLSLSASLVDIQSDESRELLTTSLKSLQILDTLRFAERAVRRELGLSTVEVPEIGTFTSSLGAFDDYMTGLQAMRAGSSADLQLARDRFRRAQDAGPFTLAQVGEAEAMLASFERGPPIETMRPAALRAIRLLLDELEVRNAVPAEFYAARLWLANLEDLNGVASAADELQRREWFERAVHIRPSFSRAYQHYAAYLRYTGRENDAAAMLEEAARLEPTAGGD